MRRPCVGRAFPALALVLLAALLAACGQATSIAPTAAPTTAPAMPTAALAAPTAMPTAALAAPTAEALSGELVIYSGRSEPLIQPVIDLFKQHYPDVNVRLKAGANNELAAGLLEERANPQADFFLTTDMLTVAHLGKEGIFEPYQPQGVDKIPEAFRDPEGMWTSFTARARVIMYHAALVQPEEAPTSVFDLADPKWKGKVAAAGSTNGSMQAHIAALLELQGAETTEQWLRGLVANDTTFFGGHTEVRKAVGAGEFAIGLVNHYYYHLQRAEPTDNNVGVVYPDQGPDQIGTVVNTTAGGIVKGGPNQAAAKAFMDFLLTPEAQRLFADLNYEYPLLEGIALAEGVKPWSEFRIAEVPMRDLYDRLPEAQALIQEVGIP